MSAQRVRVSFRGEAMSFAALAAIRGVEVPGSSALLLLFVLAEYAGDDGCCFPSQATLSDRSRLSVRAVRDNLGLLEEAGLIEQERRNRKDGTRTSNRIRLLYYIPEQAAESAACGEAHRQNDVSSNRQSAPRQPAAGADPTTFEPVSEPITSPRKRELDAAFEAWWEIYPRKAEKRAARQLFEVAVRRHGASFEDLASAAQAYAIEVHGRDPVMVKQPTTWLQRRAWLPEDTTPAASSAAPSLGLAKPVFAGPAELRARIVATRGEAWVRSWIDPCGWADAASQIIPRTAFAGERIEQELGRRLLREWGVSIGSPPPRGGG